MKKIVAIVLLAFAVLGMVFVGMGCEKTENAEYLRVHIRANSNAEEDQAVKYKVRDAVVRFLTPTVAACETKDEAMAAVKKQLSAISEIADGVLKENGYFYGAKAALRREEFPTRVYENATLAAGVYDALIVELGTGAGDNWWCVVYPPLCFTAGNGNIVYKSKISEIIRKFFA